MRQRPHTKSAIEGRNLLPFPLEGMIQQEGLFRGYPSVSPMTLIKFSPRIFRTSFSP